MNVVVNMAECACSSAANYTRKKMRGKTVEEKKGTQTNRRRDRGACARKIREAGGLSRRAGVACRGGEGRHLAFGRQLVQG